ncbi:MAG: hypothetical protein A2271_02545 [Candidatus Moranbacteria bacterium RIFOXYA12_FULL_35_19]|nr:MAG: hypothetical protein A2489_00220 [Candidatus Moranbacteria bacterium RIFOXYC12_FULL_36_13]OGI36679.1 MAG: hypothetical protein A2271_02545 [Candidatus Moranbacteria bacterium RIFOXYA12_FULL_35_19]
MTKSKTYGVLIISFAIILIILTIAYTVLFSIFGLMSGGSILMIAPLILLAILLIIGFCFLLRIGLSYWKK